MIRLYCRSMPKLAETSKKIFGAGIAESEIGLITRAILLLIKVKLSQEVGKFSFSDFEVLLRISRRDPF